MHCLIRSCGKRTNIYDQISKFSPTIQKNLDVATQGINHSKVLSKFCDFPQDQQEYRRKWRLLDSYFLVRLDLNQLLNEV